MQYCESIKHKYLEFNLQGPKRQIPTPTEEIISSLMLEDDEYLVVAIYTNE
jgi:hypothetical protein